MKTSFRYLLLTGWLLLTLLELAIATPVKLQWNPGFYLPDPARPQVTQSVLRTHLFLVDDAGKRTFLAESLGSRATVDLPPGKHKITATSEAGKDVWWEFCDPITVEVEAPPVVLPPSKVTGLRQAVIIRTSKDLKSWTVRAVVPLYPEDEPAEFVSARLAEIPEELADAENSIK